MKIILTDTSISHSPQTHQILSYSAPSILSNDIMQKKHHSLKAWVEDYY